MLRHPAVIFCARGINTLFFLATATYCVLNYSSFAYYQFIVPELIRSLPSAVAFHHAGYWAVLIATLLTLLPDLRARRWASWIYAVVAGAVGVWLVAHPLLATVDFSDRSLRMALLALVPPVWLGIADHAAVVRPNWTGTFDEGRSQVASALAAAIVVGTYTTALPIRLEQAGDVGLSGAGLAIAVSGSAIVHLVAFTVLYLTLQAIASVSVLTRARELQYWLIGLFLAAFVAVVLHEVVCTAISFTGPASWIASAAFAITMVVSWSGVAWRAAARPDRKATRDALDVWVAPLAGNRHPAYLAAALLVLPLAAFAYTSTVAHFDWNFLLQKLGALAVWGGAFALAYGASGHFRRRAPRRPLIAAYGAPFAVLAIFAVLMTAGARLAAWTGNPRLAPDYLVDHYVAVDPSFRLVRDLSRANSGEAARFYAYLKANSTISHHDVIAPVELDFVRPLAAGGGRKPHIFLFVIDSLRPDYLSPYNPSVTFTPSIGAFALDSFVFERAFTRYGGTGLAIPSIWAGGMLMHKQYVRPFDPMNTLLKLLRAEGYHRVMTIDSIVSVLVPATAPFTQLDKDTRNMAVDLCSTLDELEHMLSAEGGTSQPLFVYTLPQSAHIMVTMPRRSSTAADAFPGFFAPVAEALHRIDGCFGEFIGSLKARDLFDDSIVIVTSDHGDSLGEGGRWGHAYTIYPEVLRVPLIVHLPSWLRQQVTTDLARPTFTTDITPTLYSLLGHEPAALGRLYGEPMIVPAGRPLSDRRHEPFLVASSYGPVYGMLRHNGRRLFIANAVEGRDTLHDLSGGGNGRRIALSEGERLLNWNLIREDIGRLAAQYRFTPQP
jgi:hypothetical protein